ncbi:MAG: hypothetical protein Q4G10_02890 [Bacteroidia bacterium]|nr:hypothetical protein [Bacteroidia bacterium]
MKISKNGWRYRHFGTRSICCIIYFTVVIVWAVFYICSIAGPGNHGAVTSVILGLLLVAAAIVNLVGSFTNQGMKIDEAAKTVVLAHDKKTVMDGAKLRSILIHRTGKGRVKYVTVWFEGFGYHDIPMNEEECSDFIGKARMMNPDVEIKEYKD